MGSVPVQPLASTNTMIGLSQAKSYRDGKYTQSFTFEQGKNNGEYLRAVVERSCDALLNLLQDVFIATEKFLLKKAEAHAGLQEQNRIFRQMADVVRCRSVVERAMTLAVVSAYANLGSAENRPVISKCLAELETLRCERADIWCLFEVDHAIRQATDRNRPLLLDLNKHIARLFGNHRRDLECNPLSPATLTGGMVAGLMCADMDILAKHLLFQTFEQEFLAKLPMLMNSIVLRLDEENTVEAKATGCDESHPGPIAQVLENPSALSPAELLRMVEAMKDRLSAHQVSPLAAELYRLADHPGGVRLIQLLGDLRDISRQMEPTVSRGKLNQHETAFLVHTQTLVAGTLDRAFSGQCMPKALKGFLSSLWPEVLFDVYVMAGENSEAWRNAMQLQQDLLKSVLPQESVEYQHWLASTIPTLVKNLRCLLEEARCHYDEVKTFFAELKRLHLQNLQHRMEKEEMVCWVVLVPGDAMPSAANIIDGHDMACFHLVHDAMLRLAYR